ncbi:MAG: 2Fe-2S iron-sulfur cluster-binding protein, partial [Bacteroidia bacterium]
MIQVQETKNVAVTSANGSNGHPKNGATEIKFAYINNIPYEIKEGETIISLLRRNFGKDAVPTLCDAPNLEPFGSCRVCSVDVALAENGPVKTQASCHTPVMAGTYIYPDSDRIQKLRKNIIE